jgi:hypothetical protein
MKRQLFALFALAALVAWVPLNSADAAGVGGHGHGGRGGHIGPSARAGLPIGRGFGRGFGFNGLGFGGFGLGGFGFGDDGYCGWDIAELYRQLYNNLPYFALHPPVYYSEPVPRTYGYSPFAYPPGVMTPDIMMAPQPVTINNPYVPATTPATAPATTSDRSASAPQTPEPLVITNPFVSPATSVAKSGS